MEKDPVQAGIPMATPAPNVPQAQQQYAVAQTVPTRGDLGWYDRMPRRVICQFCGYDVITQVTYQTGSGTHLIAFGTCLMLCIPCCILPYMMDSLKDAIHTCPNCHRQVGSKRLV